MGGNTQNTRGGPTEMTQTDEEHFGSVLEAGDGVGVGN